MTFIEWFDKSGYTQAEFAGLVGTTPTAVCYWANGVKLPRRKTREKIDKIAGVSIEWITDKRDDFAEVFEKIRRTYHLVDNDEKGTFLFYVEKYLYGEEVTTNGRKKARNERKTTSRSSQSRTQATKQKPLASSRTGGRL